MIDHQQLFKSIPKQIADWTQQDVANWFRLNDIELGTEIILNGNQFLDLTPKKLINEFKLSFFLARKISQWIESQTEDFNSYVNQAKESQQIVSSQKQNHPKIQAQKDSEHLRWSQQSSEPFRNVEMTSNISKQDLQQKQKQKPTQKHIILDPIQSQSQKNYQPLKYKPNKNAQKKKPQQSEKHLESIKSQPFLNGRVDPKKKLALQLLQQNDAQNQHDAQTCNHIPDDSSDYFQQKPKPLKKICSQHCLNENDVSRILDQSLYSKNVKFVSSQLVLGGCPVLIAQYDNSMVHVTKNMKIGRNSANDIVLKTDGVSRNHAEILVEELPDAQGKPQMKYLIRDIGSKFGTFIEVDPQKPKKVSQNDCYSIGQTTIRIQKLKLYKSKQKFDITVYICLSQQQKAIFTNKVSVTIGNTRRQSQLREPKQSQVTKRCASKQKRDIEINDNDVKNYHCRFTVINSEVYLQQVEGNILEKIDKNAKFELLRNKYDAKFGDSDVVLKIQHVYKPVSYRSQ